MKVRKPSHLRFCPIHEYIVYECEPECMAIHRAFRLASHALWQYWKNRAQGAPATSTMARRCEQCRTIFNPQHRDQRFCKSACRRSQQNMRQYDSKRFDGIAKNLGAYAVRKELPTP